MTRKIKEMYEANWNFLRGGGRRKQTSSVGEVWIFSGTTQYHNTTLREKSVVKV